MTADAQLTAVMVLWTVLLGVVIVAVLPLVLYRAVRLVRATRNIETEFTQSLTAGVGIVNNTEPTAAALSQTISVAGEILATAGDIDAHSAAVEQLLTQRAGLGGVP
jgi:hypothetical protein